MDEKGYGAFLAADIARAVRASGGRALVVGGWVRDRLLESANGEGGKVGTANAQEELDMEVFGIPADDLPAVLEPFGKVEPIGKSFPVYKIRNIDVGLPRRESKSAPGHKGFLVEGDPSMTIEEAARRRDFTVNAISWDPLTGEYFDPSNGRAISTTGFSRRSIPRRSATTVSACFARFSSPRASS